MTNLKSILHVNQQQSDGIYQPVKYCPHINMRNQNKVEVNVCNALTWICHHLTYAADQVQKMSTRMNRSEYFMTLYGSLVTRGNVHIALSVQQDFYQHQGL